MLRETQSKTPTASKGNEVSAPDAQHPPRDLLVDLQSAIGDSAAGQLIQSRLQADQPIHRILNLQRTIGNRAVGRLIQKKLQVSGRNVMTMPAVPAQPKDVEIDGPELNSICQLQGTGGDQALLRTRGRELLQRAPAKVAEGDLARIKQLSEWKQKKQITGDVEGLQKWLRSKDAATLEYAQKEFEEAKKTIEAGGKFHIEDLDEGSHSAVGGNARISTGNKGELEDSEWLTHRLPSQEDRREFMDYLEQDHKQGEIGKQVKPGQKTDTKHEHYNPGRELEKKVQEWEGFKGRVVEDEARIRELAGLENKNRIAGDVEGLRERLRSKDPGVLSKARAEFENAKRTIAKGGQWHVEHHEQPAVRPPVVPPDAKPSGKGKTPSKPGEMAPVEPAARTAQGEITDPKQGPGPKGTPTPSGGTSSGETVEVPGTTVSGAKGAAPGTSTASGPIIEAEGVLNEMRTAATKGAEFNARLNGYIKAVSAMTTATAYIDAIATGLTVYATGTALPGPQREADEIRKQSEEARNGAGFFPRPSVDDVFRLYSLADAKALSEIARTCGSFSTEEHGRAKEVLKLSAGLYNQANQYNEDAFKRFVNAQAQVREETASAAEDILVGDAEKKMAVTLSGAADNYAAAARAMKASADDAEWFANLCNDMGLAGFHSLTPRCDFLHQDCEQEQKMIEEGRKAGQALLQGGEQQ